MRPHKRSASRAGFTLVELLVVIAVLGVIAAVTVSAITTAPKSRNDDAISVLKRRLMSARWEALLSRHPVVVQLADSENVQSATVLPDGSLIADTALMAMARWDRLSGSQRIDSSSASSGHPQ